MMECGLYGKDLDTLSKRWRRRGGGNERGWNEKSFEILGGI